MLRKQNETNILKRVIRFLGLVSLSIKMFQNFIRILIMGIDKKVFDMHRKDVWFSGSQAASYISEQRYFIRLFEWDRLWNLLDWCLFYVRSYWYIFDFFFHIFSVHIFAIFKMKISTKFAQNLHYFEHKNLKCCIFNEL